MTPTKTVQKYYNYAERYKKEELCAPLFCFTLLQMQLSIL